MASSMPHSHNHGQHHQRPIDPRKRWNNSHQENETEEGELRTKKYPQQEQPQQQQQQQQQHSPQPPPHNGHPKFRHRFEPPLPPPNFEPPPQHHPPPTAAGPSTVPAPSVPQDFQQRFQPPPNFPPPPPKTKSDWNSNSREYSVKDDSRSSEYYVPLTTGNGSYAGEPQPHSPAPGSASLPLLSLQSHDSVSSLKNRWNNSADTQQQTREQKEAMGNFFNALDIYAKNENGTNIMPPPPSVGAPLSMPPPPSSSSMPPPPIGIGSSSMSIPPSGAPPNFAPPDFSKPPPTVMMPLSSMPQQQHDPHQPIVSSDSYPEQRQSSSIPQDFTVPPTPEQQTSLSQTMSHAQIISSPASRSQQLQRQSPLSPSQKKQLTDAIYTTSLHWKTCDHIQKRPIQLPDDVEHISEVEWADEAPAPTHKDVAGSGAGAGTGGTSAVTNMEKAPRPKPLRTEPCFCEPDLLTETSCCVDTSCALFACQEECGTNCAAGPLCGNKRIQRREWKKLSVFDAGLKGRGLMVQEHCAIYEFIVEYVGVAVKRQYLDGLFSRYKTERMLYIMALDGDVYIDARFRGGIARYINHSCEPNCAVHRWKVKGISRAGVFALREIQEGEELTFDYQWDRKRGRALTKCHCGSVKCRGTIEMPKDVQEMERELREELEGNWMEMPVGSGSRGKGSNIGGWGLMNRVVKIYFPDNDEYYVADVAQYDIENGKHLLMYRGDDAVEEHWTDMSAQKWMLLDEPPVEGAAAEECGMGEAGRSSYAIARKDRVEGNESSLIINPPTGSAWSSTVTSPRSDCYSRSSSPLPVPTKQRNYMYIQTPVRDAMVARHTLFKCSTNSRVHIDTVNVTLPRDRNKGDDVPVRTDEDGDGAEDEDEATHLKKAYDESEDGSIWKLVVTGKEVKEAIDWLESIVVKIYHGLNGTTEAPASLPSRSSSTALNHGSSANLAAAGANVGLVPELHTSEVIIPRIIVDEVKKKYFTLKGYCYNVDVNFSHSDSKSKQFAKMTLSAELGSDLERALEYLNTELTQMCLLASAPLTNIGVYKDLGFLGGELSNKDFGMLFADLKSTTEGNASLYDCSEDLRGSTFAASFMEANRCSIWVQAEEDMGRISNNRVINEANPNKPRKIYFSVAPSRVNTLWGHLKTRIMDLNRGVQFLHLGPDRIYQSALMEPIKKNGSGGRGWNYFFDFVQRTSGASVRIDSITGSSHLRIDGGDINARGEVGTERVNEKIDIAMELIGLQIELLRDHHIRKQRWGFGRDWALLLESDNANKNTGPTSPKAGEGSSATQDVVATTHAANKPASTADSQRLSDPRAVGTACLEVSEIVTGAGLSEKVAAHACIIFYRYINLPSTDAPTSLSVNTSFKLRDIQLASLFIANKSQKVLKWKRLEAVLEHAYRVFYPGSYFSPESEEAKNWERRVIKAEKAVLAALNYDVFWPGVDWVINAVVGTKAMAEPLAENAMALALSGHVLAAGPVLWLKYGPKYAFAAIAGFLGIDIEPLFPALSLQPLTVSHAAQLIYQSCQALARAKKSVALHSKHELFSDGKVSLMGTNIQKVQKDCATYLSKHQGHAIDDSKFVSSPAYKEISGRAKLRCVFRGVRGDIIEEKILPVLAKICFESKCTIRFSDGMLDGTNDIVLEGSWKALSIAEKLLCEVASLPPPVPYEHSTAANAMLYSALAGSNTQHDHKRNSDGSTIQQVKLQPGLLEMKKIDGKHGWDGTFDSLEKYDAGWKTCVAANAPQEHLDSAGLRWWVPHQYGPSLSGSICEIFSTPKLINNGSVNMRALALLAKSHAGSYSSMQAQYPALASFLMGPEVDEAENDRTVAVSLQRWPPEKIEMKERSTSGQNMQMGYSVAALQEMQLLHQLHFLIPSPQGHPNFILPLAIALDADNHEDEKGSGGAASSMSNKAAANDILAMIERNQRTTGKKQAASGSHLVLEPTPLNLQNVMSRYQRKNKGGSIIPPAVLASWCHEILSAISFCHSNHIILRSLLPDQIHIDHSGTAKLSGLSKIMVLHGKDRTREFDPLKFVRSKKGKDHNTEDVEPFAAPEILLGGTRHTKETDMWAFGALLANLLLGKQLFPGKDRVSKMTQVFKIVGVPDRDNYERAKKFPFYSNNMFVIGDEGKKKKYSRGVEKALRHLLRAFGDHVDADFSGLISLIDGLLHLDPKRRMTADEALRHMYMMNHSVQIERQEFRQKYVKDWLDLKENVMTKGKSSKSAIFDSLVKKSVQKTVEAPIDLTGSAEKELKRKAFLIGASSGVDGDDDLYNLDDLLGPSSSKKPKFDM